MMKNTHSVLLIGTNEKCVSEFLKYAKRITGSHLPVSREDDGISDLILIGSDAVNPVTHHLIMKGTVEVLSIRSGSDDYRILSVSEEKRNILILAGGRLRAELYAVYDYFEKFCSCRFFWDGEVIPKRAALPLQGMDRLKKFRFCYRGIRYFAHRSLHRFQAEHWSWPDWKKELDYLVKRRSNLFMLRIGQDDLFQKAFPAFVDFPPEDRRDPDAIDRSYNDRTYFHGLRQRAALRKKIIRYAKTLDLIHPVDMGPMTHWYSRTPQTFLDRVKPKFFSQTTVSYAEETGKIWDFEDEKNFENYWHLTETDIKYYDSPDMFHMIGLAERKFGSQRENFQIKLYAYRRFIRRLRERYPHAPLLIAGWDLMQRWTPSEVRGLLEELDPENTILFDYTADLQIRKNEFTRWGVIRRFPYIFGIFEGLEPLNETNFDFRYADENLHLIGDDPYCKGMVLWPEMSHAHSMLQEYFMKHAAGEPFSVDDFCSDRYGTYASAMAEIWKQLAREQAVNSFWESGIPLINHFSLLGFLAKQEPKYAPAAILEQYEKMISDRPVIPGIYARLAEISKCGGNEMRLRDIVDLARSHLMSDILRVFASTMLDWKNRRNVNGEKILELIRKMRDLLATQPEYSLCDTLAELRAAHSLNPASETTLKSNAENSYCRSYVSELYEAIYIPEAEVFAEQLKNLKPGSPFDAEKLLLAEQKIRERFYLTDLSYWNTRESRGLTIILLELESLTSKT